MQVNTNTCVTCHRSLGRIAPKEGEGHGEGTGEAPAGEADEPQVPPSACDACHDPPEEPFPYEGVTISHVEFQRQERACETCHQEAAQHPPPVNGGNCLACHVKRMGDEPVEVDEMHASHIGGEHKVECFSCHGLTDHRKETEVAGRFECTKCHISDKTHVVQRANYRRGGASLPGPSPTRPASTRCWWPTWTAPAATPWSTAP